MLGLRAARSASSTIAKPGMPPSMCASSTRRDSRPTRAWVTERASTRSTVGDPAPRMGNDRASSVTITGWTSKQRLDQVAEVWSSAWPARDADDRGPVRGRRGLPRSPSRARPGSRGRPPTTRTSPPNRSSSAGSASRSCRETGPRSSGSPGHGVEQGRPLTLADDAAPFRRRQVLDQRDYWNEVGGEAPYDGWCRA